MKALTVWQPWAGLLARGTKRVENRTWAPRPCELRPGDYVAIHAGVKYDRDSWALAIGLKKELEPLGRWTVDREALWPLRGTRPNPDGDPEDATPYGAIIGVAVLDEVRSIARTLRDARGEYADPFFFGPVGWYLRAPVPIAPVWCKGAKGLWTVPPDVLAGVRSGYRAARAGETP